jgi:hypothetical protein
VNQKSVGRIGVINRAYRIVARHVIPIACICYFASNVRNVTKIIICFRRLPISTACLYEQFGIIGQHTNKFHSVWGKRGAPIYGRTPRLLESSFLINTQRNVNRPTAKPIVLSGKRSFGCLVFAAQDQYRITYKICRDDLGIAIRWGFAFLN